MLEAVGISVMTIIPERIQTVLEILPKPIRRSLGLLFRVFGLLWRIKQTNLIFFISFCQRPILLVCLPQCLGAFQALRS